MGNKKRQIVFATICRGGTVFGFSRVRTPLQWKKRVFTSTNLIFRKTLFKTKKSPIESDFFGDTSFSYPLYYLINSKLCLLKDTEVIVSEAVGDLSDVPDRELVSIFDNIIDNAIEAIEDLDEKRIELLFSRQGDNRIIICKNTIKESVLKENSELISTKKR